MPESKSGAARDKRYKIEVSRDHFTAYLNVSRSVKERELSVSDIYKALETEGITYGIKERDKLQVFLDNLDLYDYTLIVAAGKPFTQGTDAEVKFNFQTESKLAPTEDLKPPRVVDFREVGAIASVSRGDLIATKVPAVQGEPGTTVYGQNLPGEWGMDVTLLPGKNVSLAPNGLDFIAESGGAPFVSKNTIRIDEVKIINGDVNFETGNIEFGGTVAIKGSILDGFVVRAAGDIIVENTVQAAEVRALGDVIVKRGILTRGKTHVSAEGNVYAKFIENSNVEADGDIVVESAILNSKVSSNKSVIALTEEGAIIGGEILAFEKVVAKNIGSTAHSKTYIQVGYRFDVQRQYLDTAEKLRGIQKKLDEVKKSYEYVGSTSNDIDKLGELRGKAMKLLKLQKQMQDDLTEIGNGRVFNQFAAVEALGTIHPGSLIFIGDGPFNVNKEMTFAAVKWDSEMKSVYFTSFDELTRGKSAKPSKRAKTVVVIDDSKAVRKTLKLILEKMGLRVTAEADDGAEGVLRYKEMRPTLVTCDISMVNMNGIEALARIREINPKARVVMISSHNDKKKILDCVMAGAADYILKPFEPKRVMTVIRSVLEK